MPERSPRNETPRPEGVPDAARRRWTRGQAILHLGAFAGIALAAWRHPADTAFAAGVAAMALFTAVAGLRLAAVFAGLSRHAVERADLPEAPPGGWPRTTVLVPLYREAAVVPSLLQALGAIDYPAERLDVLLLIEADDDATRAAVDAATLPAGTVPVVVPPGTPRTKPRACNVGLARARGDFLVVWDAEDRPEPDQLKKAAAAFHRLPERVACLQARLNYYNDRDNLLTRWQALDYTAWFDLYLPGLHRLRAPIPLGGTSNVFRVPVLRALGGWDPFNVTEDCDLGLRLAAAGHETRILDSTTWEEAVPRLGAWLRQRTRWTKGYGQTHLVHTRSLRTWVRDFGVRGGSLMLATVGGQVLAMLLLPLCWALLGAWAVLRWPLFDPNRPWTVHVLTAAAALTFFNGVFVAVHAVGAARRRRWDLVPWALTLPVYWMLVSAGAWRGMLHLLLRPHAWEKTPHGLAAAPPPPDPAGPVESPALAGYPPARAIAPSGGRGATWLLAGLSLAALLLALRVPAWFDADRQIRWAAIRMDRGAEASRAVEQSWHGRQRIVLHVEADGPMPDPDAPAPVHRALVTLRVADGEWFQLETDRILADPVARVWRIEADLEDGWVRVPEGAPWGPWALRRVREVGVRLFGSGAEVRVLRIARVEPRGEADTAPLAVAWTQTPERIPARTVAEARFRLSRSYPNPFDPEIVDATASFHGPDGAVLQLPAFYTRDYRRPADAATDRLEPVGAPTWALRFAPPVEGRWEVRLRVRDHTGASTEAPVFAIEAMPSDQPGYLGIDPSGRHFAMADGTPVYPIAINLRSPEDTLLTEALHLPDAPHPEEGVLRMRRYLQQLAGAGVTMARLWMMPGWCGLEWRDDWPGYHGLGVYNLQNAWRIDEMMAEAERLGIWIEWALDQHGPFTQRYDVQWDDNPYNAALGGPLRQPAEVMTDPQARRLFRRRYRYLAARYGASPALFGWTLWIEANIVNPRPTELTAWHADMAPWMRKIDQERHPVSTEFTGAGIPDVWRIPAIGYTQAPAYNGGRGLVTGLVAHAGRFAGYGKPFLFEEYGGHFHGGSVPWILHEIHDGLWAGWTTSAAGTPMAWWWHVAIEHGGLPSFRRFAAFIEGEDPGADWRFGALPVTADRPLAARYRARGDRAHVWVYPPATADLRYRGGPAGGAAAYARVQGDFRPGADDPGRLFGPVDGAMLRLDPLGLDDGNYTWEAWDPWTETPPARGQVHILHGRGTLPLPPLVRDTAVRMVRAAPAPADANAPDAP